MNKENDATDNVWELLIEEEEKEEEDYHPSSFETFANARKDENDDVTPQERGFQITAFVKDRSTREAINEISKLISMANIFYGIGSLVLLGVFCFVLFALDGSPTKTIVFVALQALFYNIGSRLLEQPHSKLIGGLVYTIPAMSTPVILLSILSDAGLVSETGVFRVLGDLATLGPKRYPNNNHNRVCELSIFLELATMFVAFWQYHQNPFPGLLAPIFGSAYLILASFVLRTYGPPFDTFPSRILCGDFYLVYWSIAFAAVFFWVGTFTAFEGGNVLSPVVRFASLFTACNVGVVAIPLALWSFAGDWRHGEDGKLEISLPFHFPVNNGARIMVSFYVVSNMALLWFSLKVGSLVLAPYGLAGIVLANVIVWPRDKHFHSFFLLGVLVGGNLIVVSSGFNNVVDGQVMQLLAWLGQPTAFSWLAVLLVRGLTTLTGVVVLIACSGRINVPVLGVLVDWFGYVLLSYVSDEHEVFSVLKFVLNAGAAFFLIRCAFALSGTLLALSGHDAGLHQPQNPSAMFLLGMRAAVFAGQSVLRNAACLELMSGAMLRVFPSKNPSFGDLSSACFLSFFGTVTALLVGSKLYTTIGLASIYFIMVMLALRKTDSKTALAGIVAVMAITTISVGMAFDSYSALAQTFLPGWLASSIQGYYVRGQISERAAIEFVFDNLGLKSFYVSSSIAQK